MSDPTLPDAMPIVADLPDSPPERAHVRAGGIAPMTVGRGTVPWHEPPSPARAAERIRLRSSVRAADVVLAGTALLLLMPLMLLIMLAVKITSRGPALFSHRRLGYGGQPFACLKFRSMVATAEDQLEAVLKRDPAARAAWIRDHKLPDDPRVTAIGRYLRASSLDELPQLWNVLRGEMSLVGPRPISSAEIERYGRYIADYYDTKPGITGLWQISGRSDVSYRRRVALDVAFARSQSFGLYCRILLLTVPAVLLARGSY